MKAKKYKYFMGDFETTVYKGQVNTEVWASACVELFTEDVKIFHSIGEQFDYFKSLKQNIIVYYHNLKFDGAFWLSYLMIDLGFDQACEHLDADNPFKVRWLQEKEMSNNTFKYSVSDRGQWYTIIIKVGGYFIEIRDSLKLLPFSVKRIGESFGTKHKKLDMEYTGFRYAGCEITDEEKHYIANDVLVVKEALEIMFNEGHTDLTIGSCCLKEYKRSVGDDDYKMFFPNLYEIPIDKNLYGYENVGEYIRKSYRGGWCYLVKGKEGKIYNNGCTFDVNSLYPSMMSSESGNYYPVGMPNMWTGNIIPDEALKPKRYYFIRIKTRFYIKKDKLPFIQIKSSHLYTGTECLETTDVFNKETGLYSPYYIGFDGNVKDTRVELVLTMTDFELLKEHYELVDFEILDGCWFYAEIGLFDAYMEKYKTMKMNNKGALRELAKLFLNNLYGKMASSTDSSFKVAYLKEDKSLGFMTCMENGKKPGYIPVGSAITSYARNFTIRAAQMNYHGKDKPGFIYADTDSIHCDIPWNTVTGVKIHDKNFCCWKPESCWDIAIFTRQKTYIEHVIQEDLQDIDKPYYNIKCAGMPKKCKNLFELSMQGFEPPEGGDNYTEEEREFLKHKRTLEDFTIGLSVPGKLRPKRIRGGVLLVETPYKMR